MQEPTDPLFITLAKQYGAYLWGFIGAAVSMGLGDKQLPMRQRVTAFLAGAATSWVAFSTLATKLAIPEGLSAFLLGAFGMLILGKLYAVFQNVNLTSALNKKIGADDKPPPTTPGGPT